MNFNFNFNIPYNLPSACKIIPGIIFSDKPGNDDYRNKKTEKGTGIPLQKDDIYVILADDDADDRELFTEVIEESGVNVKLECAGDGAELINILKTKEGELPNVIFLDLNMPNMNGKECLETIRKSDRLKNIPVVIYSTSSSIIDIEETFAKGANLYVRKPSSYSDLLYMARSILSIDWNLFCQRASRANFVFSVKAR